MPTYDLISRFVEGDLTYGVVRAESGVETTGAVLNSPEFRALSVEEQTNALIIAAVAQSIPPHDAPVPRPAPAITYARMEGLPETPPEVPTLAKKKGKR